MTQDIGDRIFVIGPGTNIIHIGYCVDVQAILGVDQPIIDTFCGGRIYGQHVNQGTLRGFSMCQECVVKEREA